MLIAVAIRSFVRLVGRLGSGRGMERHWPGGRLPARGSADRSRSVRPIAHQGTGRSPTNGTVRRYVTSPVPPYEQLREQIAGLMATGLLPAGQRLPPVRQVAADLGLAGGAVARAYRELAQAGLVEGSGRHGTVVRSGARTLTDDQSAQRALSAAADHLAGIARDLGLSDDAVLAVVRDALARMAPQRA